ncbi:hypothetical protein L1987_37799 [Smallanthus sonchifolius]|uniref:Uncharacterized protein n=1 Tax=Smallanthus sonchifolius TaxID=185202 RepID=A0ACB9HIM8_9ASTR|nr:hypothetical protein L1987_37799 [Smallanthus sonchifolius]
MTKTKARVEDLTHAPPDLHTLAIGKGHNAAAGDGFFIFSNYSWNSACSQVGAAESDAPLNKVADFSDAFWRFLRPHTIRGTALGSALASTLDEEELSDFRDQFHAIDIDKRDASFLGAGDNKLVPDEASTKCTSRNTYFGAFVRREEVLYKSNAELIDQVFAIGVSNESQRPDFVDHMLGVSAKEDQRFVEDECLPNLEVRIFYHSPWRDED